MIRPRSIPELESIEHCMYYARNYLLTPIVPVRSTTIILIKPLVALCDLEECVESLIFAMKPVNLIA